MIDLIMTEKTVEKVKDLSLAKCDEWGIKDDNTVNAYTMGFVQGASNLSNLVWHTIEEEPQVYGEYKEKSYPQIPCLVLGNLSTGYGYGVRYWNVEYKVWDDEECDDYECDKKAIEKWCYLDDLIPIKD